MRQALRSNRARRAVSRSTSLPAPVEGWDASSPLADMSPKRAVILDNFFPRPTYVELRRGFEVHATGIGGGAVESLMSWEGPSSRKMFAASETDIYDVTSNAAVGSAAVSSLTNGRWQHVNFTTSGGPYLWICNGADAPRHYNGTTWATPSLTGVTASDIVHVAAHKKRLWFVLRDSTKAGYLDVDSIAGTVTTFELGSVFQLGGHLQAIGTWTIDGGDGVDDHCVFISSRGEVAVYQGTDPSSASAWSLVGVFRIGAPIGRRCLTKVGGDLAIITVDGVLPLSRSLALDRGAANAVAITARISNAVNEATRKWSGNFGWQLIGYPEGTMAILNVPVIEGGTTYQYVMNTLSGAWCRFTGMNAAAWCLLGDELYFGGMDGKVYKADSGTNDNGASITYDVQPAWNYVGSRGSQKRFHTVRPLIGTDGVVTAYIDTLVDFQNRTPFNVPTPTVPDGVLWGTSAWGTFRWSPGVQVSRQWTGGGGIGTCVSVRVRGTATGSYLNLNAFDLLYEPGGFI